MHLRFDCLYQSTKQNLVQLKFFVYIQIMLWSQRRHFMWNSNVLIYKTDFTQYSSGQGGQGGLCGHSHSPNRAAVYVLVQHKMKGGGYPFCLVTHDKSFSALNQFLCHRPTCWNYRTKSVYFYLLENKKYCHLHINTEGYILILTQMQQYHMYVMYVSVCMYLQLLNLFQTYFFI